MCDGIRDRPLPGVDLFTWWREQPFPEVGEERDLPLGDWLLRVRVTKVKDSKYKSDAKHVTMVVIG